MMNFLPDLSGWLALGAVPLLAIGAVMLFGLAPVLAVVGKAGELLIKVAEKAWDGVVWAFENVFAPGAKNIVSNGASVLTVLAVGAVLWVAADARNIKTENYLKNELAGFKRTLAQTRVDLRSCKMEVQKLGQTAKKVQKQAPAWGF